MFLIYVLEPTILYKFIQFKIMAAIYRFYISAAKLITDSQCLSRPFARSLKFKMSKPSKGTN